MYNRKHQASQMWLSEKDETRYVGKTVQEKKRKGINDQYQENGCYCYRCYELLPELTLMYLQTQCQVKEARNQKTHAVYHLYKVLKHAKLIYCVRSQDRTCLQGSLIGKALIVGFVDHYSSLDSGGLCTSFYIVKIRVVYDLCTFHCACYIVMKYLS